MDVVEVTTKDDLQVDLVDGCGGSFFPLGVVASAVTRDSDPSCKSTGWEEAMPMETVTFSGTTMREFF